MNLFKQNIYKQIYKKIKKADTIIIARHVGPDTDALLSYLGLKQIINDNFPDKKVYCIGSPAAKFRYIGELDKLPETIDNALLIVTDTPDHKRVDGIDPRRIKNSIKIYDTLIARYKLGLIYIEIDKVQADRCISYVFNKNPYIVNPYIYNQLLNAGTKINEIAESLFRNIINLC